jgi:hypothetical protein
MYSYILSEILLGQHRPSHLRGLKRSITKVNDLILKQPDMPCYKRLLTELLHLQSLINSMRGHSLNH